MDHPQTALESSAPLSWTDWVKGGIVIRLPRRTLEMLAADPVLSAGDPETDKTPTATLVRGGIKGTGRRGLLGEGSPGKVGPCPACS